MEATMQRQPLSQRTIGESGTVHNSHPAGAFDFRLRITGTAVPILATAMAIAGIIAAVVAVVLGYTEG